MYPGLIQRRNYSNLKHRSELVTPGSQLRFGLRSADPTLSSPGVGGSPLSGVEPPLIDALRDHAHAYTIHNGASTVSAPVVR